MDATPTKPSTDAEPEFSYRTATIQTFCSVCEEPAVATCPACGATFCLKHAPLDCCVDCSLEISRLERRATCWGIFLGAAASFLGIALLAPPAWYGLLGAEALASVPLLMVVGKDQGRKLVLHRNKARGGIIDGATIQLLPVQCPGPSCLPAMRKTALPRSPPRGTRPSMP
jgi:hypothetical protein